MVLVIVFKLELMNKEVSIEVARIIHWLLEDADRLK